MATGKLQGGARVGVGCLALLLTATSWAGSAMEGIPDITLARNGLGSITAASSPGGALDADDQDKEAAQALLKEQLAEKVQSYLPFPTRFELGEAQLKIRLKSGRPMLQYQKSF